MGDLEIKPNEDNTIMLDASFEVEASAYSNKEIEIISDLYSPTNKTEYSSKQINVSQNVLNVSQEFFIKNDVKLKELEDATICNVVPMLLMENTEIINERIVINGIAKIDIVYINNSSLKVDKTIIEIPYEFTYNSPSINKGTINAEIEVLDCDCIIMPNLDIDITIKTMFNVSVMSNMLINVVDEVELLDDCYDNSSLTIYRVKKRGFSLEYCKKI